MADNTALKNITGKDMLVKRQNGGNFDLLAAAKTKSVQWTNEYGETTTHNPADPNAVPWRTSLPVSRSWAMNMSGTCDMRRFGVLQADAAAVAPPVYELVFSGVAADGGGTLSGSVWVENLQLQSSNMGLVEFTFQLRGEGAPVWTAAA